MNSVLHSRNFLFFIFFFGLIQVSTAQVGINYNNALPDSSAMLDVDANDKGVLIPRLTSNQRDSISNPAEGLLIFNTDSKCFNVRKLGLWFEMCGDCIAPPVPTLSTNGPVCEGSALTISATGSAGATYAWTGPNGFTSTQQNITISNATVADSGNYTLTVSFPGCTSAPVSILAAVSSKPDSSFTAISNPTQVGQAVAFSANENGATYNWSFTSGSITSSTAQNPSVSWSSLGTYPVSLQVTKNGCVSGMAYDTIEIINCPPGSQTFNFTGAVQTFTVPPCVTSITVDAYGAQGGGSGGGPGGRAQATIPVTPGETLNIYVGGTPTTRQGGGYNGGGGLPALPCGGGSDGYPGGGGSDVRRGTALSGRLVVAGGGGGMGWSSQPGGGGGGLSGQTPVSGWVNAATNGGGGTQSAGGARGIYTSGANDAGAGSLGQGGTGGPTSGYCSGGGGGGGYWGGGGGHVSAGGGGSSFIGAPGSTNTSTSTSVRNGNGQIIISW